MATNDSLANALSKILANDKLVRATVTLFPASTLTKQVLTVLKENIYTGDYIEHDDDKGDYIILNLIGRINKCGVIKPRFSVKTQAFERFEKRYLPSRDFGIMIVSTSQGLMTHTQA